MAIELAGKTLVLNSIKNKVVKVALIGNQAGGGQPFFTAVENVTFNSKSPSSAGIELDNQVTFNVDSSAPSGATFPIQITAVTIFDNTSTIIGDGLFETNFTSPFSYSESGTFTLTEYDISVS